LASHQPAHRWLRRRLSDIVLEIKALTRRFGAFTAVDALTLSVNAGEVFGLLGSNGAGKTTTIKMLTTLLPPSSGEARVAGFSITTQAVGVRRAIGYVPQAVSVDGSLTGYENLLIFAKLYDLPHREQQARIREALEFMGLTADGGRLVGRILRRHGPPPGNRPVHAASAAGALPR
jgi:ABC-2 type transport system ATP-binding protein